MKKLYILFFICSWIFSFGQTYSITIKYRANGAGCHAAGYNWSFYGNTTSLGSFSAGGNSMDIPQTFATYSNVLNYSLFNLYLSNSCTPLGASTKDCDDNKNKQLTNIDLIKGSALGLSGCNGSVSINEFKPNVTIQNLDTANPSNVCAGSQLGLAAFPGGFPDEAYHWQYSLNSTTWIDVPAFIGAKKTNDSKTTSFTMQELLGANHVNYINKPIYFRLGYDQNRAFTDPLTMTYLACAPLVNNIEYLAPLCFGDNVRNVTVTFDRDLYSGEELRYFQLKAVDPVTNFPDGTPSIIYPFFSEDDPNNGLITKFDEKSSGVYTYSLLNFKGLNPNVTYQIQYQAFQNGVTKGVSISPETENFKYIEPAPLKFEIKKADNPTCFDDPVEVSIEVTGGTGDYRFYVDGDEKTNPKPVKETDGYYHIRGLIPTAINNIKVMDENDCIEKTP